ncbi:MAG: serine/threonine protein kinase [Victivallales bacterium]|nr:serine/threonine protein kinase [Victivallales bacterium]
MLKYTFLQPLGEGGISVLDLVSLEDGRTAVLRKLRPLQFFKIGSQLMFRRGIRIRASLPQNDGIVASYSTGYAGLCPAELIEYVPGDNLRILHNKKSAVLRENIYAILRSAAKALAFVHSCGLQHLDVKPENFLLKSGGETHVKLTDFDLTLPAEETGRRKQSGTPAYMAPEQLYGKCSSQASDVFSFCVMCYYLLSGHPPFVGSTQKSSLKRQASERVLATPLGDMVSNVPRQWEDAIMQGLEKRPDARIQNMVAWLKVLGEETNI